MMSLYYHYLHLRYLHISPFSSPSTYKLPKPIQLTSHYTNMPSWDNTPSGKMTAAVLSSPGATPPSKCFTIDKEYPKPTLPSPTWVLVKVKAAGLNRAELRGRNGDEPAPPEFGMFVDEFHPDPPKILGKVSSQTSLSQHLTDMSCR
jgi:hypothetical protein